jgi:iron complex outermembrane recepter protein
VAGPTRRTKCLTLIWRKRTNFCLGVKARMPAETTRMATVKVAGLLCFLALHQPANAQPADNPVQDSAATRGASVPDMDSLEEILVTATKRKESLQKIPISVTVISGRDLEGRNAVNFDDYARGVPDLSFTDLGDGRERIAIRGVDSKIGQAVVGYYFGETPIPDSSSVSAEKVAFDPEIVDVNRVEVLRGPQGTVFGSGSMGGTIRIIPNDPDSTKYELAIRNILSDTEHANGPAEVVSGMLNIPLIEDRLALRMSTWASWDSGFIQRQVATPDSVAAHTASDTPLMFRPVASVPPGDVFGGRVALRFQVSDSLDLDASVYSDQQYYRGFQDITTGPQNPGNALVQNFLFDQQEQNRNRLTISNFKLSADVGVADLLTSLSYTRRLLSLEQEAAAALEYIGFSPAFSAAPIIEAGRDDAYFGEARLSSKTSGSSAWDKLQWLLGASYGYQKGWTDISFVVPGFSQAFESITGPVAGNNLFEENAIAWIRQSALFGELRFEPLDKLSLTAGARWYFYSRTDAQPESGLFSNSPNNSSIPEPYTAPTVRGAANGVVYRGAISWQQSLGLMYYAQASEGFRGPFGRFAIPNACAAEAVQLGANTAQGEVASDKLWNYEVGAKSNWLSDRLRVNVSLYRIDWSNVQQSIFLNCGFSLKENLGSVVNKGAEVEIEARITRVLSAGSSVGYVNSALQQDIVGIPGTEGQPLPDVPKTTGGAFLSYTLGDFGFWSGTARADYSYTGGSISTYAAGTSFAPDKGSLALLGAQLTLRRSNLEVSLFGRNILDRISRTALERDVSLEVPDRLRYAVNIPRTVGIGFAYRQ